MDLESHHYYELWLVSISNLKVPQYQCRALGNQLLLVLLLLSPSSSSSSSSSLQFSVGYLAQEPQLEGETVQDNINLGVKKLQDVLDRFSELSAKCAEPLEADEMEKTMAELSDLQDKIDAGNLWEIDRLKERAMLSLRCPPPEAQIKVLSGGEKR